MKVGDLVVLPLDEHGYATEGYNISLEYLIHDPDDPDHWPWRYRDPGPLMIMKTAVTNEGRQMVVVHLATEIHEWDFEQSYYNWTYVDEFGYKLIN